MTKEQIIKLWELINKYKDACNSSFWDDDDDLDGIMENMNNTMQELHGFIKSIKQP